MTAIHVARCFMISRVGPTQLSFCWLTLLLLPAGDGIADESRDEAIARVATYSEEKLVTEIESLLVDRDPRWKPDYDICLMELLQRDHQDWRPFLQEKLEALNSARLHVAEGHPGISGQHYNLELLTVLRRIQGKPDPLEIIVEPLETHALEPLQLPRLTVSLKNVDEIPVGVSMGGDYRSGRLTRWRVIITDEAGHVLPVKPWPLGLGGGLMSSQLLNPNDQQRPTELILEHRVQFERPGKYTARVAYHNSQSILEAESLTGYVLSYSRPFEFDVRPVDIKQSESAIESIQTLIDELDESEPVRLLVGEYGPWAEDFIPQDSPQGKLLSIGVAAVPTLIETLELESTSPELAAHILGILFAITRQHDPRVDRPIGSYRYLADGWSIKNGVQVSQSSGTVDRGDIHLEDQAALIKRWLTWKNHMLRVVN